MPTEAVGSAGLELTLGGGVQVNGVSYTLTGPHSYGQAASFPVNNSSVASALIGGIPAGSGYVFSLSATSTDGTFLCTGQSQPFAILPQQTTAVSLALSCASAYPDAGSVAVAAVGNSCPTIDQLAALPASAQVGGAMSLLGFARGLDPSALLYSWSTTDGTLSSTSGPNPSLTCTGVGQPTVTLVVTDGSDAANCAATATITVTCTN